MVSRAKHMHVNYVQAGDQQVAFIESAGQGPAIVFVHGNSLSSSTFRPQFASALSKKFRMVALDLPGHGSSEPALRPQETYSLPGYAELMVEFTVKTGTSQAIFVGSSLGGHVLLEAAEMLKPQGLMIIGSPPFAKPLTLEGRFLPSDFNMAVKAEIEEAEVSRWASLLLRPGSGLDRRPLLESIRQTDGRAREMLGHSLFSGRYKDEVGVVRNLACPLAVIHGQEEQLVDGSFFGTISMPSLWRGSVQVVKGAGHLPQLEQPEAFNRILEEFVRKGRGN